MMEILIYKDGILQNTLTVKDMETVLKTMEQELAKGNNHFEIQNKKE